MIDEAHKITDDNLEALEKRLSSIYDQAVNEMVYKWEQFSEEYAIELRQMKQKLKKGLISDDDFMAWKRDMAITNDWYRDMVETLSLDAVNVDKIAAATINGTLPQTYAENFNFGMFQIEKAARIGTAFTLYDQDTVLRLVREMPSLLPYVKIDSAKDLRWNQQKFTSAITQGILQGESIENMSKRLVRVMGMDYNNAVRNARTATTAAENAGRINSYERAKSMGIDVKKQWMATLDGRTRHSHRQLDGEVREYDMPFSNKLMYPGDPNGIPAEVYNCRCTLVAKIGDVDVMAGERYSKLGDMSYSEWKEFKTKKDNNNGQ